MPEELWMEVHDTVQEAVIKTIPQKQKYKKAKWLSEEALQIAEKRREAKSKLEKERHVHLNAEFQRIERLSHLCLLSDQCTHYGSKFGKLSRGHRTGKGQFSFQFQRNTMPKNVQTTTQLHSSHMLTK